jgi:hypothetical protein
MTWHVEHANEPSQAPARHKKTHRSRVGQNHIYTVYIRYFWKGKYEIYGHIRSYGVYIQFWPTLHRRDGSFTLAEVFAQEPELNCPRLTDMCIEFSRSIVCALLMPIETESSPGSAYACNTVT